MKRQVRWKNQMCWGKEACQTSINTHPAQPTEARRRDRVEIITTLCSQPEGQLGPKALLRQLEGRDREYKASLSGVEDSSHLPGWSLWLI